MYSYSTEQINQIKAQNAIVQRASEAAQKVSAVASSSYGAAQEKVHTLSDVMLQELHKVQVGSNFPLVVYILISFPPQASTSSLPATVQSSFHDITAQISNTITELSTILTSPEPFPDRVHKVRETVQERVQPLLEASACRVQEILDSLRGKAAEKVEETQNATNGDANGHSS